MNRNSARTVARVLAGFLAVSYMFAGSVTAAPLPEAEVNAIYGNWVHYKVSKGDDSGTCSVDAELEGSGNKAKAFNFLVGEGLEPHQASGVVGNLLGESSLIPKRKQGAGMQTINSVDPIVADIKNGDPPSMGFGIAQWTSPGRQQAWLDLAAKTGKDPLSLELQLQYLMQELKTGDYGYKELKAAGDVRQATWIFLAFFEKPGAVIDAGKARDPVQPTGGAAKDTLDARVGLANTVGGDDVITTDSAPTTGEDCSEGAGSKFNISTFNIYYNTDDSNADYSKNQWQERLERSANVIKNNDLDVVGIQEVRETQWARLQDSDRLGSTYDIYPDKYGAGGYTSQNPIVWNKDRFDLEKGTTLPGYAVTSGANSKGRTQVKLKDKSTGQRFYVINQHEPVHDGSAIKERFDSANQLAAHVKDLGKEGLPVFLTGDFNSGYDNRAAQPTYNNDRNNLAYCILTDGGLLWDAFDAAKNKPGKCPTPDGPGVDHIFMSPSVKASGYDRSNEPRGNGSDVHPTVFVSVEIPGESAPGDAVISPDGHAFPLAISRAGMLKGSAGSVWCYTKTTNCHHDYNAADMFAPTGTPVLATIGGKVLSAKDHDDSTVGSRVTIMGDDGKLYYYAHMGDGTIKVKNNQRIDVGKQIGSVGTSADAVGTDPHLHIDALPGKKYNYRPECSGAACSGYPFYDIQNTMNKLFKLVK